MQASIGCAQIDKLEAFTERRRENWTYLKNELSDLSHFLILPEEENNSKASWFGFIVTVKDNVGFTRNELTKFLEKKNVQTRNLFAGNILRHPCFDEMRESGTGYRVIGDLNNTDKIMNNTFWIGVYPGMEKEKLSYMVKVIKDFAKAIQNK